MQRAILYTLRTEEVAYGDFITLRAHNMPNVWTDDGKSIAPIKEDRFVVPVEDVKRCVAPTTRLVRPDPYVEPEYEHMFIAMEPALREILEDPFQHKLNQAYDRRDYYDRELCRMERKIGEFYNSPWWKRCYISITKGVL